MKRKSIIMKAFKEKNSKITSNHLWFFNYSQRWLLMLWPNDTFASHQSLEKEENTCDFCEPWQWPNLDGAYISLWALTMAYLKHAKEIKNPMIAINVTTRLVVTWMLVLILLKLTHFTISFDKGLRILSLQWVFGFGG